MALFPVATHARDSCLSRRSLPCAPKRLLSRRRRQGGRAQRLWRRVEMARDIRIALDAMGGDYGPPVVVPAAAIALVRRPDVSFQIYGDEKIILPLLARHPPLVRKSTVIHCDVSIKMTDKPSQALRAGRRTSSMWQAIDAVKRQEADCVVSAGNTGALMAMAKFCLRTLPHIDRPALAVLWLADHHAGRGDAVVKLLELARRVPGARLDIVGMIDVLEGDLKRHLHGDGSTSCSRTPGSVRGSML